MPPGLKQAVGENDVAVFYTSNDDPRPHFNVQPFHFSSNHCSPALTGASKTTELMNANGKAEWGRVDLGELMGQEGYIPPYNTENVKCGGSPNVYAFCSEQEGKTVLICISQVTKDEALAKQIFETFRWTK